MSTISQTPKVNAARTLNIRPVNLLIVAALVLGVVAIFASTASPAAKPVDRSAYMLYRQGEWLSVPISVSNAEAYQIFRLGEWASVTIPAATGLDLTAYHLSERTLVDANSNFAEYLLSEHTLTDPQAGMAIYLNSERTSVPVHFTQYQRSEWFGE